jgi:hypothetical protein
MKSVCWQHLPAAYQKVSDGGRLPANARQVMYAIRPLVIEACGKFYAQDATFTQTILPGFIDANPELTADWVIAYDDRGQALEPHTGHRVGLGTLAVRGYIQRWEQPSRKAAVTISMDTPTVGPAGRFRYALFLEKEGFNALIEAASIAERYDMMVMSTKGMSVTAARELVEALSNQGVTILVGRDLDKAGFSIIETLRSDTRRYRYTTEPEVIDLGLRLEDAEAMGLETETCVIKQDVHPGERLRECGATEEEIALLVDDHEDNGADGVWNGQRIELNAMTSRQFVDWLEAKFAEHGVEKVVPDDETLAAAYRRAVLLARMQDACDRIAKEPVDDIPIPTDLGTGLDLALENNPAASWDAIVADRAAEVVTGKNPGGDAELSS